MDWEYLLKFKNVSYLHTKWVSPSDLQSMSKSAKTMLNRFLNKIEKAEDKADIEDPNIDISWVTVDKILDSTEIEELVEVAEETGEDAAEPMDIENEEEEEEEDEDMKAHKLYVEKIIAKSDKCRTQYEEVSNVECAPHLRVVLLL